MAEYQYREYVQLVNGLIIKNTPIALATGLKMAISATIAFCIYNGFNLGYGYWSVITVGTITQLGLADTTIKGLMRIIGTVLGACLAYWIAIYAQQNVLVILAAIFVFITISSYFAVQATRFTYGGTVFGITFAIVLAASFLTGDLKGVAITRTFEVLLGIAVVITMDLLLSLLIFKFDNTNMWASLKSLPAEAAKFSLNKRYCMPAIKIALACSLTSLLWAYFHIPESFWATITCLTIMEESTPRSRGKSLQRFLAHIVAALFATICTIIIGAHIWWKLIPLIIGFFFCGYMIGSSKDKTYFGNTTAVAIAIMLLIDPANHDHTVIFYRFINVTIGIVVGLVVIHLSSINYNKQNSE